MTDIDLIPMETLAPKRAGVPVRLLRGLIGGCALGVFARLWMRLIAEDPDFTWNGTIFIVLAFTIFGLTQTISSVTGQHGRKRWAASSGRVVGIIGLLPLFVGAGAVMLPTVVGGGLAAARRDWHRAIRIACLLLAAFPVVIVGHDLIDTFGWSLQAIAGFVLLLAVYGTIVRVARPTLGRRAGAVRLPRAIKAIAWSVVVLATLFFTVGFIFR